jgi:hypothetical protein
MTRTITLATGGQRFVYRCSGDSQTPLVEKLIRLARSRPDVAKRVHLRPLGIRADHDGSAVTG